MQPLNNTFPKVLWPLWKKRLHPEWVFPNAKTGDRYYDRRRIMRTICKRAGVRHFGYHAIRHYVASLLADRGGSSCHRYPTAPKMQVQEVAPAAWFGLEISVEV